MSNKNLSERTHQYNLFMWAALNYEQEPRLRLLNSCQNGMHSSAYTANSAKKVGMKNGYPDIFLPVAKGNVHGLFIELKKKGGVLTPEQRWWNAQLMAGGYLCFTLVGHEQAIEMIASYLEMKTYKGLDNKLYQRGNGINE